MTLILLLWVGMLQAYCPPCKSDEICYPGVGCLRLTEAGEPCGSTCIYRSKTPSIQCLNVSCGNDVSICQEVSDSDPCSLPPVIPSTGCVLKGAPIQCAVGECHSLIGCIEIQEAMPTTETNSDQNAIILFFILFAFLCFVIVAIFLCCFIMQQRAKEV
jgi:hypothetical protein